MRIKKPTKARVVTLRLSIEESSLVEKFIKKNAFFDGFSTLARVAILDFMSKRGTIEIKPVATNKPKPQTKPSFLWDYDMSEGEIRETLASSLNKRKWLVARILEHAKFEEVWDYLSLDQIERDLPHLRIPAKCKEHWGYAIKIWRDHERTN